MPVSLNSIREELQNGRRLVHISELLQLVCYAYKMDASVHDEATSWPVNYLSGLSAFRAKMLSVKYFSKCLRIFLVVFR